MHNIYPNYYLKSIILLSLTNLNHHVNDILNALLYSLSTSTHLYFILIHSYDEDASIFVHTHNNVFSKIWILNNNTQSIIYSFLFFWFYWFNIPKKTNDYVYNPYSLN